MHRGRGKAGRAPLTPEDVLAGRVQVAAREIVALVRQVNPTGLGLPAAETSRRYALKSRLQSLLIRRFPEEIAVQVEAGADGVVLLVHRPSGAEACHAPIDSLDEDARSWVQRKVDLGEVGAASTPEGAGASATAGADTGASAGIEAMPDAGEGEEGQAPVSLDVDEAPANALLRAGQEALEGYDYERARRYLEGALERSGGSGRFAAALLELLVDHLAADEEALGVGARLGPEAARRGEVRGLLAVAAARRGAREAALHWLGGLAGARAGEALAALARAALEAGDVEGAERDVTEGEARCPGHPGIRAVGGAIAVRRAAERAPLEAEVLRLVDRGALEEAAQRAREVLARWPESGAARRALEVHEAARRRAAAERALEEAEVALAARQVVAALGLLRQAMSGVGPEEARGIQARIAAIEGEERARAEAAEIERVTGLLEEVEPAEGLLAYVGLEERRREAVRARVSRPELGWLEEMGARGSGARARAAVQAALALGQAEALVVDAPEEALELLAAHARALQGVRRARRLEEEAAQRRDARRREQARAALRGALVAEETADSLRARALLEGFAVRDFPDSARPAAAALSARLARRRQRRRRAAQIEELRRRGEPLRARLLVDEALAGAEDAEEGAQWAALRAEVQAEVQAAFRVHVLGADAEPAPLDVNIGAFRGKDALCPDGQSFVVGASYGAWTFLRFYELATGSLRHCVVLRTPQPLRMSSNDITADRIILRGWEGHVLEIALDTWEVLRWISLVPQPGPEGEELPLPACAARDPGSAGQGAPDREEPLPRISVPRFTDARQVPESALFWIVGVGNTTVTILDTLTERPLRELSLSDVTIRPIEGLREPLMAVLRGRGAALSLYTGRGASRAPERRLPALAMGYGIAPAPGRDGLLVMAHALWGAKDRTCEVGWLELPLDARAPASPFRLLRGAEGAEACAAATDDAAGLSFFLLALPDDRRELVALGRAGASGPIAPCWRTPVPARSVLLQHGDAGRVTLLVAREHGFDAAPLGAAQPGPPVVLEEEAPGDASIPDDALRASYRDCVVPGGAIAVATGAWLRRLRGVSGEGIAAIAEQVREQLDPDQAAGLSLAWMGRASLEAGARFADWAWQRTPDHAGLCMLQGMALINARRWSDARALLSRVDVRGLDPQLARHVHHLWATASLHLGEREEARAVLDAAEHYEGSCALDWLIALAVPLEEERAWTPVQAAVRALGRAVAEADALLAQGDGAGAARALERRIVWETREVQSLARLAEAHLSVDGDGPRGRLRKALALASFQAAQQERRFPVRRELPMPSGKWPAARLRALRERAEAWLEETMVSG